MRQLSFLTLVLIATTAQTFGQTNRINHYSHSGSSKTIEIFKANDNMGLNCGSISNKEYQPDTNLSIKPVLDTTKNKISKPINTSSEKPRRGLSLEQTYKVHDVLNKF